MGVRIRRCSTVSCKPGDTIDLTVEGFRNDPARGCFVAWSLVSGPNSGLVNPGNNPQDAEFTASEPGCYTIRAFCKCNAANVPGD